MSDFEMVYMLNEMFNSVFAAITIYASVVFAFPVVCVLFAGKLTRTISAFALITFSFFAVWLTGVTLFTMYNLVALSHKIAAAASAGHSSLAWLNFIGIGGLPLVAPFVIPAVMVFAAAGVIYFFFQQRKSQLAAATGQQTGA